MRAAEIPQLEMSLLLEAIQRRYGYDFREYAEASLHRRLHKWLGESPFRTFSEAQGVVLRDADCFATLLQALTVHVSELFRDPPFWKLLRSEVMPFLRTYPFVKLWVAGCATGEEAYSLAILLEEEGLAGRYRLYATDVDPAVLEQAKQGIYPLSQLQRFTQSYQKAGGRKSFSDYYHAQYDRAQLEPSLRQAMVFSAHNLATDAVFGDMHLVLCRNVLIYFQPTLKARVLTLLDAATQPGAYLGLGTKESLAFTCLEGSYTEVAAGSRLYRKAHGIPL